MCDRLILTDGSYFTQKGLNIKKGVYYSAMSRPIIDKTKRSRKVGGGISEEDYKLYLKVKEKTGLSQRELIVGTAIRWMRGLER